jgi:hypothetical protein
MEHRNEGPEAVKHQASAYWFFHESRVFDMPCLYRIQMSKSSALAYIDVADLLLLRLRYDNEIGMSISSHATVSCMEVILHIQVGSPLVAISTS